MKSVFLITARLKSTRLPLKVIRKLYDRPLIAHMLDRLKMCSGLDEIVICTSKEAQDDPLEEIAITERVSCFRGESEDVVARLANAADRFSADYVLNITADCPLIEPEYISQTIAHYQKTGTDLIRSWDLPHGVFCYGINPEALNRVLEIKKTKDTEVWYKYFSDTKYFSVDDLEIVNKFHSRPGLRMTVDYPEDWKFLEAIFDHLYRPGEIFTLTEILQFLDENPEVKQINSNCANRFADRYKKQSEIYLKPQSSVKAAVIIGCGSIGQRHIANLRKLGISKLYSVRTRKGFTKELLEEWSVVECESWNELAKYELDVGIVANPSIHHIETATKLAPLVQGIFIEKPLAVCASELENICEQLEVEKKTIFMGFNLLFDPLILLIKALISAKNFGHLICFQAQCGQWLPDWHPYEEYMTSYAAREDLGGGVALTLMHELQLATEFAGLPAVVYGRNASSDLLQLKNVEALSDCMITHESGAVSQVHLDYLQKPRHRTGCLSFSRGWISYDLNKKIVQEMDPASGEIEVHHVGQERRGNDSYYDEMRCFVQFVEEGRVIHPYDLSIGMTSLQIVDAIKESSREGKAVEILNNRRFEF
jgi:spore coat polysaccharide biosynthesis protein SpsF